jgi:hypothetical protein
MFSQSALLFALALTPVQETKPKLDLINVRPTYGFLGPVREFQGVLRIPAGEWLYVSFDIVGLVPDAQGKSAFETKIEIQPPGNKPLLEKNIGEIRFVNVLSSRQVQHTVQVPTFLNTDVGRYVLTVKVTDRNTKGEGSFTFNFDLSNPDFAFTRFQVSYDENVLASAPNVGTVGQVMFVTVNVIGFKKDANKNNEGEVMVEMSVLNEQGQPTGKPIPAYFSNLPQGTNSLPVTFTFPVTQSGRFRINFTATDKLVTPPRVITLNLPFIAIDPRSPK